MRACRTDRRSSHQRALDALKVAILDGATHEYERLIDNAVRAGATEQQLDLLIHDALEDLFMGAEQPVTQRELANFEPVAPLHELVV